MFTLYWTSADSQGDVAMGDYSTNAETLVMYCTLRLSEVRFGQSRKVAA